MTQEKSQRPRVFGLAGLGCGLAIYILRAILVLTYQAADIGGPNLDAGQMAWMPFFLVDVPWSILFNAIAYSSNSLAIFVYATIVGLPWILYGMLGFGLCNYLYHFRRSALARGPQ